MFPWECECCNPKYIANNKQSKFRHIAKMAKQSGSIPSNGAVRSFPIEFNYSAQTNAFLAEVKISTKHLKTDADITDAFEVTLDEYGYDVSVLLGDALTMNSQLKALRVAKSEKAEQLKQLIDSSVLTEEQGSGPNEDEKKEFAKLDKLTKYEIIKKKRFLLVLVKACDIHLSNEDNSRDKHILELFQTWIEEVSARRDNACGQSREVSTSAVETSILPSYFKKNEEYIVEPMEPSSKRKKEDDENLTGLFGRWCN